MAQADTKVRHPDGTETTLPTATIFVSTTHDGAVVADLVDPHGIHLRDALPKLRGLADFAERHR